MEFRVLGSLEVFGERGRVPVRGARQTAVLAALLLNFAQTVSTESLGLAVWEHVPKSAHSNLRTYVSQLRQAFAESGLPTSVLVTEFNGYRLDIRADQCDLARFQALARSGESAFRRAQADLAFDQLGRALDQWRGRPLPGVGVGPLLQDELTTLCERRIQARQCWAEAALAIHRYDEATAELAAVVRSEPFHERLWALLMLALYRSGRQAEALRAFGRLTRVLDSELGVAPSRPLRVLHRMVLAADPALDAAVAVPGVLDLGAAGYSAG
jgi:DNA-binding SARP family transcriptional activator